MSTNTNGTLNVSVTVMLPVQWRERTVQVLESKEFPHYDFALEYWRNIQKTNPSIKFTGTYTIAMPE